MDIVFLGSGAFGLPALHALAASGHSILHVISQPDRPAGRGKVLTPTPVAQWAMEGGEGRIPLTRTADANGADVLALLRSLRPECLVVIAFGQKLSDELLSIAPRGGVNLHSSLLPKYRGAAPINWAVINGDAVAGVCVIEITNVMDGGDILAVAETPIGESETAGELHDRLAALGAPLLPRVLDELAAGTVRRVKQEKGAGGGGGGDAGTEVVSRDGMGGFFAPGERGVGADSGDESVAGGAGGVFRSDGEDADERDVVEGARDGDGSDACAGYARDDFGGWNGCLREWLG